MRTLRTFAIAAALLLAAAPAHAATYMLLTSTNAFAAGITNAAKAYADSLPKGSTNWVDTPTGSANLTNTSTVGNLVALTNIGVGVPNTLNGILDNVPLNYYADDGSKPSLLFRYGNTDNYGAAFMGSSFEFNLSNPRNGGRISIGTNAGDILIAPASGKSVIVNQPALTGAESNSLVSLNTIWNTTGNPSALKLVITDTASGSTAKAIEVLGGAAGTTALFSVAKSGRTTAGELIVSTSGIWGTANNAVLSLGSSQDVILIRDATSTLALRNGANAQTFNIYNTYTDASNYERGEIAWASNILTIGTRKAGTGSARNLRFFTDGVSRWDINSAGHFLAATDNTYDIGASSATRPRSVFVGPSGGFGSSATNTTVVVSATGATNTLGVNTILYVTAATGASLTDASGVTEFSGVTIANFTPVRMQPGGKFVATGVTYATGTSSHAW